ncbi:ester cyclase [Pseudovibrio ascidiaceicola]|uniref:ester cyclase n=1 Tax=Pseudovibrio ascidiaceicola TaxID=285279 RepID=UPI000D6900B2|nr:ester cyclase [Pseudovibrio ascidiaceicola]
MNKVKLAVAAAALALSTAVAGATEATDLLSKFYEVADSRPFDADKLAAFYADDMVDHNGREGQNAKQFAVGTYTALAAGAPDSRHELGMVEPIGDDKVLIYWRYKGTNTDGLFGAEANGNAFDIAGFEVYRVENGKIHEFWHVEELSSLSAQLAAKK